MSVVGHVWLWLVSIGSAIARACDGYNSLPYLTGKTNEGRRKKLLSINGDAWLMAILFATASKHSHVPAASTVPLFPQYQPASFDVGMKPSTCLGAPKKRGK
jgi:hypothetical protein